MRFSPGCGCCLPPPPPGCPEGICSIWADEWLVNLSGITGTHCFSTLSCNTSFGGAHILTFNSLCFWTKTFNTGCSAVSHLYKLMFDSFEVNLFLEENPAAPIVIVHYKIATANFNCFGPNVLDRVSQIGTCSWPLTATVSPA